MTRVTEGEEKEKYELLLEILTPVVKTYPSEMGMISVSNGLQVLGGSGFCKDFPLENYYRDIRIYPLYEGTTGIQSLDLLGRKITMKQGKAVQLLFAEVKKDLEAAKTHPELTKYVKILEEKLQNLQAVTMRLVGIAMKGKMWNYSSRTQPYIWNFSELSLLHGNGSNKLLLLSKLYSLKIHKDHELEFYESKIHTMKFYFAYEVPKTLGLIQRLMDDEVLTIATEREIAV